MINEQRGSPNSDDQSLIRWVADVGAGAQAFGAIVPGRGNRHRVHVLNTALIQLKDRDWALTSVSDLYEARLLPGARKKKKKGEQRGDVEQPRPPIEEFPIFEWKFYDQRCAISKHFTDIKDDISNAKVARNALDHIRTREKGKPFGSLEEPSEHSNDDVSDDAKGLRDFISFLVEWKSLYVDLSGISEDDVEEIHILTFDTTFGLPGKRAKSKEKTSERSKKSIKLTSADPYEFPSLWGSKWGPDGYGIASVASGLSNGKLSLQQSPGIAEIETPIPRVYYGSDFTVCTALCLTEVLTDIFIPSTDCPDRICVRSMQETLEKDVSTLFNALRIYYTRNVTLVVYSRDHDPEKLSCEKVYAELHSIVGSSRAGSGQTRKDFEKTSESKVELSPEDFDERALARFFRDGILFTHQGATLKAALISDIKQEVAGKYFQKNNSSFHVKFLHSNELLPHLVKQVDWRTFRALCKFEKISADGDAAIGNIARWRQWVSRIYVFTVVILSILVPVFNWKDADSTWDRLFGGIEFATFFLVGFVGLARLTAEDPNVVRNTFLGFARLRTEDDVCSYTGTQNLPLALALYKKAAHWANGKYTSYAAYPTHGGISILSGLDMKSARMAGIYPISESIAVDLRFGILRRIEGGRSIEGGHDPENGVFRLGKPISPGTTVNVKKPLTKGVFRGAF